MPEDWRTELPRMPEGERGIVKRPVRYRVLDGETGTTTNPGERAMIYNVSVALTADDNGVCYSFTSERQARQCYANMLTAGAFSLHYWTT